MKKSSGMSNVYWLAVPIGIVAILYTTWHLTEPKSLGSEFHRGKEFVKSLNKEEVNLASYIELKDYTCKKRLLENTWIINGTLYNNHPSQAISWLKLKFVFTDGSEYQSFSKLVNPKATFFNPFRRKVYGHETAELEAIEIVEAY